MSKLKILASAAVLGVAGLAPLSASATPVGLELALLTDVSGSVDATEYALQKGGYVAAFQDPTIQAAIASITGGIAVAYYEWSGAAEQATKVNWTHIYDAATANAFATALAATSRSFSGLTAPGSAINFATPLFGTETGGTDNLFESSRQVIDVSGDGEENDGATTSVARNAALAAGVEAINGLPIGGGAALLAWYQNNIQGGTNSFTLPAANFNDFEAAVKSKIGREITDTVPEPTFLALFGIGLAGFAAARRRQAKA
jgi:hypothetical protein